MNTDSASTATPIVQDGGISKFENYMFGIAKAYPVLIPFAGIIYSLLGENTLGFMLAFFSILDNLLNVYVFKGASKSLYERWYPEGTPDCQSELLRPRDGNKRDCGSFGFSESDLPKLSSTLASVNENGNGLKDCVEQFGIGMPSGHSQHATAMTILMIMIILGQKSKMVYRVMASIFLIGMAIWVMVSRVMLNCHNANQVLVGSFIGYIMGLIFYHLMEKYHPEGIEKLSDTWKYVLWTVPPVLYILAIIYNNFVTQ